MQTTILNRADLGLAVEALTRGELVAFPTETVYGLGANGLDGQACRKIFTAKGRPQDNPLILHVLDQDWLARLIRGTLAPSAKALIEAFWPGPLTVVVPSHDKVPAIVRAGLDTVAVRAPSHLLARALIRGVGVPLAAPSANLSGRPSPTTAEAVFEDMNGRIPYIIDGGPSQVGLESTVVDCTTTPVTLLRPGGISIESLAGVVGEVSLPAAGSPVRSPGMKYRHYAPNAPLIWIRDTNVDFIHRALEQISEEYGRVAVAAPDPVVLSRAFLFESLGNDEFAAAQRLFHAIRTLDQENPDVIVVVWELEQGLGLAVANRIAKAAVRQVRP